MELTSGRIKGDSISFAVFHDADAIGQRLAKAKLGGGERKLLTKQLPPGLRLILRVVQGDHDVVD